MKRILVFALLVGLLISTIGVTIAVGGGNPIITKPIFKSDYSGYWVSAAVGRVTLNTETGEWTLRTMGPLPNSDADLYYLTITTSAPLAGPHGRYNDGDAWILATQRSIDGRVEASGTVDPDFLRTIIMFLEDRGVFLLTLNSI